ncbi:sensor domain-containing diguanylate cyclase [Piscinibacter sakaiensis]|uniref:GGDEF domain-containing protein n=1 Tax=Piscinibacter sakaiensis TaxID=1547922 RepID=A0A0K8NXB7_PISS1|nr:diguanylate cyclase [Piscinibacter sakaiensis]GAP35021.1 hypothetical protein ISF6_0586 [Piscinibacter sakaiensis]
MSDLPPPFARLRAALGSLKLRVALGVVLALVVGIGATTLLLVRQAERDTLALVRERELGEAVRAAQGLSRRVVALQRALALASSQFDPAVLGDEAALGRLLLGQPLLGELFNMVFVADTGGQVRMAIGARGLMQPPLRLSDRDYFTRALRERRAVISGAVPSRLDGAPTLLFAQPLLHGGAVYGMLVGGINLAQRELLVPTVDTDVAGDVLRVVTDADGLILAHPNRSLVMASLATEPRLAGALERWRAVGSPVEPAGLMLAERGEVVAVGGVAGPDWLVWRAVDEAGLLEPLHAARRQALGWAAVLVAACGLATLAGLWWVLRPLRRLTDRAEHLFDPHNDPAQGWPEAGGEIGSLAAVLRRVGTERARLEQANASLLGKLGSVMGNAPVGIAFTRAQRFELVSAEFCRLLGRREEELLGQRSVMIYDSAADYAALGPKVRAAFAAGEPYVGDVPMRRGDGTRFWAHLRGRPVDPGDDEAGTIWTVTDVSEQVATRARLEWSAHHDALTGLANRQRLEQRLQRVLDGLPGTLPAALVMVDLDRFKPINDGAGHAAGDAMLCAVADVLRARIRTRDLAVRLGGDEFALVLEHCPPEAAVQLAEDVRAALAGIALPWDGRQLQLSASLGVASLHPQIAGVAHWLRVADEACYEAKAAGRNCVRAAPLPRAPLLVLRA